ncbi:diguanylate cyclase [Candidatus Heimdallarchaeota archaeon B3_Heim]|nr:MAG: diguanylate cyclase [Candidatus Heimdallarchaeota archaeon B3_Heim]
MDPIEKKAIYTKIIKNLSQTFESNENTGPSEIYKVIITELATIPYYDWTGIYLLDYIEQELNLDYYIGLETDHVKIPVGKGVCGSAVAERTDKIVQDVREEANYLACSVGTRSEIVVLIEDGDKIIGQIDIDSNQVGVFDEVDQEYLRIISQMIIEQVNSLDGGLHR